MSTNHVSGFNFLVFFLCVSVLLFIGFCYFILRISSRRIKIRILWSIIIAFIVVFGLVQYGPFIGKTVGLEYSLSLPRALISIEFGNARLVPLTSDGKSMVGRKGPVEQELTAFLEKNGWMYQDKVGDNSIYFKDKDILKVHSHFQRGYWWIELDSTPYILK